MYKFIKINNFDRFSNVKKLPRISSTKTFSNTNQFNSHPDRNRNIVDMYSRNKVKNSNGNLVYKFYL